MAATRHRGLTIAMLVPLLVVAAAGTAWSAFRAPATVTTPVATAVVAPPTGVAALETCLKGKGKNAGTSWVTVTWTPSTSPFVTSYTILRADNGGPATVVATGVTGASWDDTGIAKKTTYDYTVQAVYRSWTATSAAPATVTTAAFC